MADTYIFECSSTTYLDCVERGVFGSNKPWPLQVRAGDYCLLHHYEIGGLLGVWTAVTDGAKDLEPKLWRGKFPYQVRVKLIVPKVTSVPQAVLTGLGIDPSSAKLAGPVDADWAEELLTACGVTSKPTN